MANEPTVINPPVDNSIQDNTPPEPAGGGFVEELLDKLAQAGKEAGEPPPDDQKTTAATPPEDKMKGAPEDKKAEKEPPEPAKPKNMTAAAEAKWNEIRAEAKQAKAAHSEIETKYKTVETQLAEREAKIRELEASTAKLADIDRLNAQIQEYESELSVARIEATPEFKRSVLEPMAQILSHADRLATKYGVPKSTIIAALEDPDLESQNKKIEAFASEWSERDRFNLYTFGDDYTKLSSRREAMKTNAQEAYKQIQEREAKEQEQAAAHERQEWNRASSQAWERVKPFFPEIADEEAKQILGSVAGTNFMGESAQGRAYAAFSAVLLPKALGSNKSLRAENAELHATIAKLQKAKPGGGSTDEPGKTTTQSGEDPGFVKSILSQIQGR